VAWSKRTLLGTIGYQNLSNHSIGPILLEEIRSKDWANHITLEEMNWGPIAIVQWFQSLDKPFDRVVLFTAIERAKREIGDVTIFRWGGKTPSDKRIQACIGDAVTGVISPENLLIIGEHFKIWPEEVYIVDVEPGPENAGTTLSVEVGERVVEYLEILEIVCREGWQSEKNFAILYGDQISVQ
jgi:hypothetical protein